MTPRQLRRAAERKIRKQERKAANGFVFSSEPATTSAFPEPQAQFPERPIQNPDRSGGSNPISSSQLAANRANSQLSTGPKTPEGKATSSLNSVKTALTGRTVLLATDDAAKYEKHLQDFLKELRPVGIREHALAQSLADTAWRLDRIPALEMAIFAHGHMQFANQFDDHAAALRSGLIELHTFLTYEKQLRNLQIQEMRLRRQREKDTAELRQMQQERIREEKETLETAAKLYTAAKHDQQPFDPAEYDLHCSVEDVERYLKGVRAANLFNASLEQEREQAKQRAAS